VSPGAVSLPVDTEQRTDMNIFVLWTWMEARLGRSERGASMVEYGLLIGLIFLVAIVAVKAFGSGVSTQYSTIDSQVR
jgi:Flp pilus assembly pilin Flp